MFYTSRATQDAGARRGRVGGRGDSHPVRGVVCECTCRRTRTLLVTTLWCWLHFGPGQPASLWDGKNIRSTAHLSCLVFDTSKPWKTCNTSRHILRSAPSAYLSASPCAAPACSRAGIRARNLKTWLSSRAAQQRDRMTRQLRPGRPMPAPGIAQAVLKPGAHGMSRSPLPSCATMAEGGVRMRP